MATTMDDFWNALITKQEKRVADLKVKKCDLRHRLQALKRTMPAYLSFNMTQMNSKHPDRALKNFIEDLLHPKDTLLGRVNVNCTCDPCPIGDDDVDLVPVKDIRDRSVGVALTTTDASCGCDICETEADAENPICKCAVCTAGESGFVCDCAMCSPPETQTTDECICHCEICTAAFSATQRSGNMLPDPEPICKCEICEEARCECDGSEETRMGKTDEPSSKTCECKPKQITIVDNPCPCGKGRKLADTNASDDVPPKKCSCTPCPHDEGKESSSESSESESSESEEEEKCNCTSKR